MNYYPLQEGILAQAFRFGLFCLLLLMMACGSPPQASSEPTIEATVAAVAPTESPATEVPATEVAATEVPPTELPPTEEVPTEVAATEVPPTEVPPTEVPPTATAVASTFNGIVQGRTPVGAPSLGSPDAPVVLTDYSDFL
ncbi:MAG: hypothetical protein HC837_18755 [Chloroflexaceae bacterium]|nr:hypothetical protein [Chloroflexaceae bacterium]